MAAKKDVAVRGAKLVKKAVETAKAGGVVEAPEPVPAAVLRKLVMPNGEKISAGMKELLAFDGGWLGVDYDEDEGEIEGMSVEEIVEEHFGEDAVAAFGEAYDVLSGDAVFLGVELDQPAFLYAGEADDAGEYPIVTLSWEGGVARVGGFVPFDVWVAQQLGAVERGTGFGFVPPEYEGAAKILADRNGDGRVVFEPKAGEASGDDDDDDDEGAGDEA